MAVEWSWAKMYHGGWRHAKNENIQGAQLTRWPAWVSHSPKYSFNLQSLFTHLNFSYLETDCWHVTRTSGWQKSGNEESFLKNRMDFISTCHSLILRFSCFNVTLNFLSQTSYVRTSQISSDFKYISGMFITNTT